MLFSFSELAEYTGGEWLVQAPEGSGITAISSDSRRLEADQAFLALRGESFDGHDFAAAAAGTAAVLIVDRTVSVTDTPVLLVQDTLAAYQALATVHRQRFPDLFVVGITGSCGKTSSKEIISSVLSAAFGADRVLQTRGNTNNQIGVPQNLLRLSAHHRAAVLELGTNQPGEIAVLTRMVQAHAAVITNVGPVHLEGLINLDGVAREKASIFEGLTEGGLAVLGPALANNPVVRRVLPCRVATVGFEDHADIRIDYEGSDLVQARFSVQTRSGHSWRVCWSLRGRHMALNAGAAIAIAEELGLPDTTVQRGLTESRLPGMRMEVTEVTEVTWINDAYNANPASMRALIQWLIDAPASGGETILVLGDMLELGPEAPALHAELLAYARAALPQARLLVFGPIFTRVATAPTQAFTDFAQLQAALQKDLQPGDRVALKGSRGMALERLLPAVE